MVSQKEFDDAMSDLAKAEAEIKRLRAAIKAHDGFDEECADREMRRRRAEEGDVS